MDDSSFVFTATTSTELPAPVGSSGQAFAKNPPRTKTKEKKKQAIDLSRYSPLVPFVTTVLVLAVLGVVALGDRSPATPRKPSPSISSVVPVEEEDDFARWVITEHHRSRMQPAKETQGRPEKTEQVTLRFITDSLRKVLGPRE